MNNEEKRSMASAADKNCFAVEKGLLTVLHVDDDPNDTALLRAASQKAGVEFELHNVEDGEQAIAYLKGKGEYADRTRFRLPALVLLDLKLPRSTGFEILKWIRNDPSLSSMPIIVLSGSELQDDIRNAYAEGANSYLVKPLGFSALVELIKCINKVWLAANTQQPWVPPRAGGESPAGVAHLR
jgi:CheY-like chemotaxis protein